MINQHQYQQQIDDLMQQEVSRGDFIKFMGLAALGLVGVTSFLKNLDEGVRPIAKRSVKQLSDYGMSAYGH